MGTTHSQVRLNRARYPKVPRSAGIHTGTRIEPASKLATYAALSSSTAARLILLNYASHASTHLATFFSRTTREDPVESLHRFRVSIRRLRTSLKLYQSLASNRNNVQQLRKRLARITRLSNRTRDLQVILTLTRELTGTTRNSSSTLASSLISNLQRRESYALRRLRESLAKERVWFSRSLLRELNELFSASHNNDLGQKKPPFVALFRDLERALSKKLARSLRAISSLKDARELHNARLAAKRLRYLLEPLCTPDSRIEKKLASLRELQNTLGRMRDLEMLQREIEGRTQSNRMLRESGQFSHQALKHKRQRLFEEFSSRWLEKKPRTLKRLPARSIQISPASALLVGPIKRLALLKGSPTKGARHYEPGQRHSGQRHSRQRQPAHTH